MEQFRSGRIDVLIATSIIEVGIDVPNATVMVIQHAERFGLSASEARRLITQGAVSLDAETVTDLDIPADSTGLLRVGKRRETTL